MSVITKIKNLEDHLLKMFIRDNPITLTEENLNIVFSNNIHGAPFANYQEHLAAMFDFLYGLKAEHHKNNYRLYKPIKVLSQVYFCYFLLKDASENKKSFFEKHNILQYDENTFARLISYLFIEIEDQLFLEKEILAEFSISHIYLVEEIDILVQLFYPQLNSHVKNSMIYTYNENMTLLITYTDMKKGYWRNKHFVHLLVYGTILTRQKTYPLLKTIPELQKLQKTT
ncbi:MAG TPA: hypothetical protein DCL21_02190 [Alphaproteobacteria bacterium]|nr:hypothetical protein [Alphaproteobacteria bacterium]